jgi:hypothetical protein
MTILCRPSPDLGRSMLWRNLFGAFFPNLLNIFKDNQISKRGTDVLVFEYN